MGCFSLVNAKGMTIQSVTNPWCPGKYQQSHGLIQSFLKVF